MQVANVISAPEADTAPASVNLAELYRQSDIQSLFDELARDFVGLAPVKTRIRETAALLRISLKYNSPLAGLPISLTTASKVLSSFSSFRLVLPYMI